MQPIISTRTRLLGVTGWPVEHSLSPAMHNAALCAAGLDYVYLAFPVAPEAFESAMRGLAKAGAVGINCTIPHKDAALRLCDEITEDARIARAVNTLHFRPGGIFGANTDVEGFVESLRQDAGFDFPGKNVVLFGAGGAGRAIALGILRAGTARLTLINRTVEKAEALAAELQPLFPAQTIAVLPHESDHAGFIAALESADLIANSTSLGLKETDPPPCDPSAIATGAVVFDAAYTARRSTAWLRAAAARGLKTLDGMGMLVRQGAASFRIWTGVDPDVRVMFDALPH